MKHLSTVITIFFGILLLMSGSANAVVVGWGSATSNSIASNCPSFCTSADNGTFTRDSDGGEFQSNAFSDVSTASGTTEAESMLTGGAAIATPILRAYSTAQDRAGAFSHSVGAQGYSYAGSAQTITLDLTLSAILDETFVSTSPSPSKASAVARVAVIFASNLDFWTDFGTLVFEAAPPGSVVDQTSMFANVDQGLRALVTVRDSLTFAVLPGDEFLVWASLDADAFRGGEADARNTFTMDFLDAAGRSIVDPSILAAESMAGIGAVPLPAGLWLFLSGIGLIAGLSRHRKTPQPS